MPRKIEVSSAPILVFILPDAHSPNALEPPALFIIDTIIPSMTRNMSMPILDLSDNTPSSPSSNMCNIDVSRLKCAVKSPPYRRLPIIMPINRELYTSLVISASIIATSGGISDQNVAYSSGIYSVNVFINVSPFFHIVFIYQEFIAVP